MRSKHRYSGRSGRERESFQRGRPRSDRIGAITSLTTGRELNTATTVQRPGHWPSSRDGRDLAGVSANEGINRLVISGMVARVSGGQPHLQRFPLVRPSLRGDRAVFGLSIPPTLTSRHEVPLHLSTGNTEDKHKAGIPQSSPAGTGRHSSWPFPP